MVGAPPQNRHLSFACNACSHPARLFAPALERSPVQLSYTRALVLMLHTLRGAQLLEGDGKGGKRKKGGDDDDDSDDEDEDEDEDADGDARGRFRSVSFVLARERERPWLPLCLLNSFKSPCFVFADIGFWQRPKRQPHTRAMIVRARKVPLRTLLTATTQMIRQKLRTKKTFLGGCESRHAEEATLISESFNVARCYQVARAAFLASAKNRHTRQKVTVEVQPVSVNSRAPQCARPTISAG